VLVVVVGLVVVVVSSLLLRPYCDERVSVCLSVSVRLSARNHIFGTTLPMLTKFFVRNTYGRGCLSPPVAA